MKIFFTMLCLSNGVFSQHYPGDKKVGVQLFQWKFTDIESECVNFLGPNGYGNVQTSPIQHHIKSYEEMFPGSDPYQWWLAYQPVGYEIGNRLGTEEEFASMVSSCNSVGVNVVTDVVINHMAHGDLNITSGQFGPPTEWISTSFNESFPTAGYTAEHFHDHLCTHYCDWEVDWEVHNCRLFGLVDLATEHPYVRQKIADFFNKLISYGVYGFRIDASKSIPKDDIDEILKLTNDNHAGVRPYIIHEFMYGYASGSGYGTYIDSGMITDMEYAKTVGTHFRNNEHSSTDTLKYALSSTTFGKKHRSHVVDLLENHDKERDDDGEVNLALSNVNNGWWYKQASIFNILYDRGVPIVHSGYKLTQKASDTLDEKPISAPYDVNGYILPVNFNQDGTCSEEWMCQHRWDSIYPLVKVRNSIDLLNNIYTLPNLQDNGYLSNQIYWGIAGLYYAVINSKQGADNNQDMSQKIQTGLPKGTYCNVLYASNQNNTCTVYPNLILSNEKITYTVNENGETDIVINHADESRGVVLYHDPSSMINPENYTTLTVIVDTNTYFPNNLYITGSMSGWNTCNPHRCENISPYLWKCENIKLQAGITYEWKFIKYKDNECELVDWLSPYNEKINISSNTIINRYI